jgi:hypothetical protein
MARTLGIFFLIALAGCSGVPRVQSAASPCSAGEASYACQVERYHNVNVD